MKALSWKETVCIGILASFLLVSQYEVGRRSEPGERFAPKKKTHRQQKDCSGVFRTQLNQLWQHFPSYRWNSHEGF